MKNGIGWTGVALCLAGLSACVPEPVYNSGRPAASYDAGRALRADILAGRIVLANKPSRDLWLAAGQSWMTAEEREKATLLFAQQDAAEPTEDQARHRREAASAVQLEQDNKAHSVCQYHGRMAAINNQTPALIDLQSMAAGGSAFNACMDLYRQTGIIPGS